jgi:hypothetical protein
MATTLGVPPPPKRAPSRQLAATVPRKRGRGWLILGALLAIGAGIALAIVLVGT